MLVCSLVSALGKAGEALSLVRELSDPGTVVYSCTIGHEASAFAELVR